MAMTVGELLATFDLDADPARRGIANAELAMHGLQRDTDGRIRDMRGRFVELSRSLDDVARHTDDAGESGRRAGKKFSLLGGLGGMLGKLGSSLGSVASQAALIGAKLGAAVPAAAGLAATLVQIAPAAGLAATGILGVIAANVALKIGLSGVDDAVSAAFDPEKAKQFEEALKKLSPNARSFVLALKGLKPQLDEIRKSVQDRLFQDLDQQIKTTAKAALPQLRTALVDSAGTLNIMGRSVLSAATKLGESGALGKALNGATRGLKNMAGLPGVVVQGLVQIGAAAAPSFERLTSAAGSAIGGLSLRLNKAFESGAMQDAIETAIDLVGDLLEVFANVGKIVMSVFKAADASGGGFINTLKEITGALSKAFASKPVQEGLRALFSTMATLAKTAAPLLGQALGAIAPVLVALGPPAKVLIEALGNALKPIIAALSPILVQAAKAIGALVIAVSPLLPVIGNLVADLLPLLSPLLEAITELFVGLTPVVQEIADLLGSGALQPVITGLTDVLTELVEQGAQQFLDLIILLLPEIPKLTPLLVQIGKSFGDILTALAPLLPQLTLLGQQLIEELLPAVLPLIPPLVQLAVLFLKLATEVITKVVVPALAGIIKIVGGMRKALSPAIDAVTWVTTNIARGFQWLYDILIGHSIIPDLINGIVRWFAGLPGKAWNALANLGSSIAGRARDAGAAMLRAIRDKISDAVSAVRRLPGQASSVLGSIGSTLWNAGSRLVGGLINGIFSRFGDVRSTLSQLTALLPDWKGPAEKDAKILRGSGQLVMRGFEAGLLDGVPGIRRQLGGLTTGLPGMTTGGLSTGPAGAGGPAVVQLRGDGSAAANLVLELMRSAVTTRGGNVQLVVGQRGA